MNQVGRYAVSSEVNGVQLMKMVIELTEKDKMIMWSEGYLDEVIDNLPIYARDILENRKKKWEDTKAYYQDQVNAIVEQGLFQEKLKGGRKEFALFVMENFPEYQSLLFAIYDGKLKDADFRKFVYRRRFGQRKMYLH